MPTLIRLVIVLLVLGGLAYGAMFGIVSVVDPGEKDVTVRIPARDLVAAPERAPVRREIDTTRTAPAAEPAAPDAEPTPAPGTGEPLPEPTAAPADGEVVTVAPPGVE